ncbi:unnamed protein product [Auanema sp. JU1783]|nr:unnamed protein product [Auanema sp. JU1783]
MGRGKNARRKSRLQEISQLGDMDKLEFKMDFIKEVGSRWKRNPVFTRAIRGPTAEVTCGFQGIPFCVIGVKGEGASVKAAEANLAFNFLSFLENGYISKESVRNIRGRWSQSTEEIDEIVNVFQFIENVLKGNAYEELRTSRDETTPTCRSLARNLKTKVKAALKRKDQGFMQNPSSTRKRKNEDSISEDQPKVRKTDIGAVIRGADDDEIICLDDTGDLSTSINVSPAKEKDTMKILEAWAALEKKGFYAGSESLADWCSKNCLPVDFERSLLGVEYCAPHGHQDRINNYISKYPDDIERLEKNIWKHYESNGQNTLIYNSKMEARELLLEQISLLFPRRHLQMFAVGSTVNGCGSYNSDMDLCLCMPKEGTIDDFEVDRTSAMRVLRKINTAMSTRPAFRKLVRRADFVPAKVPIIKMKMNPPYEELDLDINVNNTAGIYNSHLIHYYSKVDARFPALALLIKHWAITNNVNDPMNGTLNSYSIILLVLHYLQCGVRPAVLPNLQYLFPKRFSDMPPLNELHLYQDLIGVPERPMNSSSIAELLIGFFYYYRSFDFTTYAISIRNGKRFLRAKMSIDTQHYQMYLEEPFDGKNTARCVTKPHSMHSIRHAINKACIQFCEKSPRLSNIDVKV